MVRVPPLLGVALSLSSITSSSSSSITPCLWLLRKRPHGNRLRAWGPCVLPQLPSLAHSPASSSSSSVLHSSSSFFPSSSSLCQGSQADRGSPSSDGHDDVGAGCCLLLKPVAGRCHPQCVLSAALLPARRTGHGLPLARCARCGQPGRQARRDSHA